MDEDKFSKIAVRLPDNSQFVVTYAPNKFPEKDRRKSDDQSAVSMEKTMNPFKEPNFDAALPETISQTRSNIAYVLTYAPDRFPYRDYLAPNEQTNLESEFWILFNSLDLVCSKRKFKDLRPTLEALLADSFMAYKSGNDTEGLDLLYKFEELIFGPLL